MKQAPRWLLVVLHVLAWVALAYLAGWLRFQHAVKPGDTLNDPEDVQELLGWLLLIGFFYLNWLRLAPKLFFRGRRITYLLVVIFGIVAVIGLPMLLTAGMEEPARSGPAFPRLLSPQVRFVQEYSGFILLYGVMVLGTLVYLSQRRLRQREADIRKGELAQLQAQARPHFLFNTLNGLYGLALTEDAPRTANALLQVSDFLRYTTEHAGREHVPLSKELEHLEAYIALQKLRLEDTVCVTQDLSRLENATQSNTLAIAPLVLLTLVENAFKHGVNPERKSWIDLRVGLADRRLHFQIRNSRDEDNGPGTRLEGGGLGLTNLRRRLELLYPGDHELLIHDQDKDHFAVDLHLELSALSQ